MTDTPVPTTADIHAMSPEQAAEALAALTATYKATEPVTAQDMINKFAGDSEKIAKLNAGDPAARREFDALAAEIIGMDNVTTALDPSAMTSGKLNETKAGVQWLREIGFGDDVIRDVLAGDSVERTVRDGVANWKARAMRDKIFVEAS